MPGRAETDRDLFVLRGGSVTGETGVESRTDNPTSDCVCASLPTEGGAGDTCRGVSVSVGRPVPYSEARRSPGARATLLSLRVPRVYEGCCTGDMSSSCAGGVDTVPTGEKLVPTGEKLVPTGEKL
eukprot:Rhum_TRINITY_DN14777_c13_g2::Rhum_TRINITY_DN14777_c13_g2_i1::g.116030::m.116030